MAPQAAAVGWDGELGGVAARTGGSRGARPRPTPAPVRCGACRSTPPAVAAAPGRWDPTPALYPHPPVHGSARRHGGGGQTRCRRRSPRVARRGAKRRSGAGRAATAVADAHGRMDVVHGSRYSVGWPQRDSLRRSPTTRGDSDLRQRDKEGASQCPSGPLVPPPPLPPTPPLPATTAVVTVEAPTPAKRAGELLPRWPPSPTPHSPGPYTRRGHGLDGQTMAATATPRRVQWWGAGEAPRRSGRPTCRGDCTVGADGEKRRSRARGGALVDMAEIHVHVTGEMGSGRSCGGPWWQSRWGVAGASAGTTRQSSIVGTGRKI